LSPFFITVASGIDLAVGHHHPLGSLQTRALWSVLDPALQQVVQHAINILFADDLADLLIMVGVDQLRDQLRSWEERL
jgi:hypothetical protein